jgi:hypothetical protein
MLTITSRQPATGDYSSVSVHVRISRFCTVTSKHSQPPGVMFRKVKTPEFAVEGLLCR